MPAEPPIAWPELEAKIARWIALEAEAGEAFALPGETFADDREEKFARWVVMAASVHPRFRFVRNETVHWSPPTKALAASRVALLSTGGIRLVSQPPYEVDCERADAAWNEIPAHAAASDFAIDHEHYSHADADRDVNCMLPIERLRELAAAGEIGEVAPRHVGLMGCISDPTELSERTAPAIAELLVRDNVDLVLLTPG
ncbi:MAG: glycine/sarcosine/betaine reductase selenoprotein B family protein [Chloroflexi bacterium]|nr:glycine/sarcosine/betaine reductase selenoprotein B family protein [Chloroflexota bacterium]